MKAKMENKPAEAGKYLCNVCSTKFRYESGTLTCPKCGTLTPDNMVRIDVRNDPDEEKMYTEDDFIGG